MNNLSNNPYTIGAKPKRFLAERNEMLRMDQMIGKKSAKRKAQLRTNDARL